MLVSICILLLTNLEKTSWLLKVAKIQHQKEWLSNLLLFLPGTSYLCWSVFVSCCWLSWRRLPGSWRLNIYSSQERLYNLFLLSQEHLIYAGEHLYHVACQAGEDFMAPKGWTFIHHRRDFIIHFCPMNILFIYICILLLAKLEKTPWLLKAANIHSPQEGLSNISILVPGTSYSCWWAFVSCCWLSWRRLPGSWRLPTSTPLRRDCLIFSSVSQKHLIYAGEHFYPAPGQAGEDSLPGSSRLPTSTLVMATLSKRQRRKANESFDNGVFFDIEAKRTPSIVSKLFS